MATPVDLYKAGKYDECIAAIDSMPKPTEPSFINLMGVCYMRNAKVDKALELFDIVLAAEPENGEAKGNKQGALMLQCSLKSDAANAKFRSGDFAGALN